MFSYVVSEPHSVADVCIDVIRFMCGLFPIAYVIVYGAHKVHNIHNMNVEHLVPMT